MIEAARQIGDEAAQPLPTDEDALLDQATQRSLHGAEAVGRALQQFFLGGEAGAGLPLSALDELEQRFAQHDVLRHTILLRVSQQVAEDGLFLRHGRAAQHT
jgi:hypothetical protein